MKGLLASAQQQTPEQVPQNKTLPDNQQTYDLISGLMKKIFFGQMAQELKQKMQQKPDSVPAIVRGVVSSMLMQLQEQAAKKGMRIPPKVAIQSAMKLGRHIAELALSVGALQKGQEKQVIESAVFAGIADYGQKAQIPPEEAKQYQQVLQAVKEKMQPTKADVKQEVDEVTNEPTY